MKRFKTLSFKHHVFLGFIGVSLIPLIACSFFMVKIYTVTTEYQIDRDGAKQIGDIKDRLSTLFESQIKACEALCEDDLAALGLIDNKMVEYQKELYLNLYNIRDSMPSGSCFTVYDAGGYLRFSTNVDTELRVYPVYWGLIRKVRRSNGAEFYAADPVLNPDSKTIIQTGYPIEGSTGLRMGYILISLSKESLDSYFDGLYSSKDTIVITDPYKNLIYTSNSKYGSHIMDKVYEGSGDSGFWYGHMVEPYSGFNIVLQKSSVIPKDTVKSMYKLSLTIAFFCLIVCVILSLRIGRDLTEPISRLNQGMDKVKDGDLSVYIETERRDELGTLTENFNRMTRDLNDHVNALINREKALNETKLQLFQTQLNPHFLYNTLDSIRWTARLHEIDEIVSMSENLAIILRESISNGSFTTLKEELGLVHNYIAIQMLRFSNKFEYGAEIPFELEDCIVPKMILQPIVENAIIHGLAHRSGGSIFIYADQVGSNIHINVTDDGEGMDQEMLDWINSGNVEKREGHLGLYNVDNIIKLYYGHEFGLRAVVEDGIGTTVTVLLPIIKGDFND